MITADSRLAGMRLLVVDDMIANVELLAMMLTFAGYTAVDATTDPTAVAAMQEAKGYDLIISDLRMPGLDGFGLLDLLRARYPDQHLPILVITAQTDQESRLRALDLGATDFLHKPFNQQEVLNRVRNMLTARRLFLDQQEAAQILERKVQERTRELRETTLYAIESLGRAAEFRDNETGLHVVRMSHYSALIAHAMGLDARRVELVRQASTMHDVGKIGIPDAILLKPGRLTAEEFAIMQTHTAIGAVILGPHQSEVLCLARQIARSHHEKWDGSGYPEGLAGEAISLEARIVALADVFDALMSARPYKPAWSLERTLEHIEAASGSHFDPAVVAAFHAVLPHILDIQQRYAEPDSAGETPEAYASRA